MKKTKNKSIKSVKGGYDFSKITYISSEVALIIASYFESANRLTKKNSFALNFEQWNPDVRRTLYELGFFNIVGIEEDKVLLTKSGETTLRRLRSYRDTNGEAVANLIRDLGYDPFDINTPIYEALVEAITNTIDHAYPRKKSGNDFSDKYWWSTGAINQKAGELSLFVWDQGITIPGSLKLVSSDWKFYENYKRQFNKMIARLKADGSQNENSNICEDGQSLAAAMTVGRTSTGVKGRGRGLPCYQDAVNSCIEGELIIRSGYGWYKKKKDKKAKYGISAGRLHGTLVVWKLKMPSSDYEDKYSQ
jgi:hypothetical protein